MIRLVGFEPTPERRELSLRAGRSHSTQAIPASETLFNIPVPGVVQNHRSVGATWKVGGGELSAAHTHGLRQTVNGLGSTPPGFPPPGFGGGNANIQLEENIVGLAWTWKI